MVDVFLNVNVNPRKKQSLIMMSEILFGAMYDRLKTEFKDYRASLRKIIRKAKRDYYTHIFNRHKK